jgi:hypothetical protein
MVSDTMLISHFGFFTAYVMSIGMMLNVFDDDVPPRTILTRFRS